MTTLVALAGNPNAGKTSIFNMLTGARQKVGNYPGVTVEKKFGQIDLGDDKDVTVLDLPGTYSLVPISPDEEIAVKILNHQGDLADDPKLIVAVIDASNLERSLGFVLELKQLGKPLVVALNMMDLATKRGLNVDLGALSKELGVIVVPTIGTKKSGVERLRETINKEIHKSGGVSPSSTVQASASGELSAQDKQERVAQILKAAVRTPTGADRLTHTLDKLLLHPLLGPVILAVILLMIFQAVFSWAEAPMEWVESGVGFIGETVASFLPEGFLQSLIVDGIIAGVGSVIVFLPQILILFFFIYLLEGSGYMTRAAFLLDRMMSWVGLPGRAFVPLLSSFACAIPGIMATRALATPRDRLLTMMIAPLMTCSARLPVYVLLIGAFIPSREVFGIVNLQALAMFGLFLAGVVSAMMAAFVFKMTALPGTRTTFLMEMPTYKLPQPRYVFLNIVARAKAFLKKAGTVIMGVSIVLWALATFPQAPEDYEGSQLTYSAAGRIGLAIAPVLEPVGFDWRIATGLIPGFGAREVMVGALGTVFAIEGADEDEEQALSLQERIQETWPLATGLALLAWYVFAPQCLATFAVVRRETNGWKWPLVAFGYLLVLAYLAAFVTNKVATLFAA